MSATIFVKKEYEEKNDQLEFFLAIFYVSVLGIVAYFLKVDYRRLLSELSAFDFCILVLAVFRLTRLFVYDGIMSYLRDSCLIQEEVTDPDSGAKKIIYIQPRRGWRKVVANLLACPWCVGVWMSALVVIFYYSVPVATFFILILAIAGLSTFVQLLANAIGWQAEQKKLTVEAQKKTA